MALWRHTSQIRLDVTASSWRGVCRHLAESLHHEVPYIPGESIQLALAQRERLGSTALGRGVVVPHAVMEGVDTMVLAFVRTQAPINIPTPDNTAPDLWVGVLIPPHEPQHAERQLTVLTHLLAHHDTREALRQHNKPEDVLRLWQTWVPGDTL